MKMKKIVSVIFIFVMILLWQMMYSFNLLDINILPSPTKILSAISYALLGDRIILHSISSLKRVMFGFILALVLGCSSGLLLGGYESIRLIFEPIIELLRPIPPIAWIPIAIILFGLGDVSSYFIVFLGAFFPIFTNTLFGVISFPEKYRNLVSSLRIGKVTYYSKVILPFSVPYIFYGIKIGIGMAWMSVIASEMIGAQSGLGYYIQLNRLMLATDKIIVGMIFIGILGYFLVTCVKLLERRIVHWRTL